MPAPQGQGHLSVAPQCLHRSWHLVCLLDEQMLQGGGPSGARLQDSNPDCRFVTRGFSCSEPQQPLLGQGRVRVPVPCRLPEKRQGRHGQGTEQGWVHSESPRSGICDLSNDANLAAKGVGNRPPDLPVREMRRVPRRVLEPRDVVWGLPPCDDRGDNRDPASSRPSSLALASLSPPNPSGTWRPQT